MALGGAEVGWVGAVVGGGEGVQRFGWREQWKEPRSKNPYDLFVNVESCPERSPTGRIRGAKTHA